MEQQKPSQSWRRPGFTIPGYARAASLKALAAPGRVQWTPEQAREWNRRNAEKRRSEREAREASL